MRPFDQFGDATKVRARLASLICCNKFELLSAISANSMGMRHQTFCHTDVLGEDRSQVRKARLVWGRATIPIDCSLSHLRKSLADSVLATKSDVETYCTRVSISHRNFKMFSKKLKTSTTNLRKLPLCPPRALSSISLFSPVKPCSFIQQSMFYIYARLHRYDYGRAKFGTLGEEGVIFAPYTTFES